MSYTLMVQSMSRVSYRIGKRDLKGKISVRWMLVGDMLPPMSSVEAKLLTDV